MNIPEQVRNEQNEERRRVGPKQKQQQKDRERERERGVMVREGFFRRIQRGLGSLVRVCVRSSPVPQWSVLYVPRSRCQNGQDLCSTRSKAMLRCTVATPCSVLCQLTHSTHTHTHTHSTHTHTHTHTHAHARTLTPYSPMQPGANSRCLISLISILSFLSFLLDFNFQNLHLFPPFRVSI